MLVQQARSCLQCRVHSSIESSHLARCAYRQPRATAVPAAAAEVGTGAFPDPVIDALERSGEHAKAAYILFGKFQENQGQAVDIKGEDLAGPSGLKSLEGCTGVANMLGYNGTKNVLSKPVTVGSNLLDVAGVPKPSFLGYIAKGKRVNTQNGDLPELVIAFRGSSVSADWVNNLLGGVAAKNVYEQGRVHQGFHNMLYVAPDPDEATPIKAIDAALAEYLKEYQQYPPRIVTIGHSLGGALATIAAAHIAIKHEQYHVTHADYTQRPLQTYTFAAPRVGDAALCSYFANTLGLTAVQVQNVQDPVPLCAPAPGEGMAALKKVVRLVRAHFPAWVPGAARGADGGIAPAAADESEATYAAALDDRLSAYEKLAEMFLDTKQLDDYIREQQHDMAAGVLKPSSAEALSPASVRQNIRYAKDLLMTLKTHWSDNPAPPVGVFDSKEGGNWGGPMHSLEVYLGSIHTLEKK